MIPTLPSALRRIALEHAKPWVFALIIVALLAGKCAVGQQTATLAEVLARNSVPSNTAPIPHLYSRITSYAALNDPRQFVIAYYLAGKNEELHFPLHLARLDKRTGEWRGAEVADVKVRAGVGAHRGPSVGCLGSVLRIQERHGLYYLDLHWTPSAGCLLLLKQDFTIKTTLPGWYVAFLKGAVLWEHNMIHFAPTHPAQLWFYELATGRSERAYPQPQDPLREDFKHRLAAVVDQNECRKNNWPCDPNDFGSDIGEVEVNEQTAAIAIRVRFSTEGFLTRKQAEDSGAWYDDDYVYLYRLSPFGWRAFPIYDLKPKFGTDSLSELLTPEKLRAIFAIRP